MDKKRTVIPGTLDKSKSEQPLNADWIFKMPPELIVPFLQGVADGDGYASPRKLVAGIGTKHNKSFFKKLLNIFEIDSANGSTGIVIIRKKALLNATNLPLFKCADGRQFRLREITKMIASMKHSKVSPAERKRVLEYYKQGINVNQIGSLLWVDFGKARRTNTIQKVIDDANL